MKPYHNRLHYQRIQRPSFNKFCNFWIKILASWSKMPSWSISTWNLWKAISRNHLRRHWTLLHTSRAIRFQSSEPISIFLIDFIKNRQLNRGTTRKILWKWPEEKSSPWPSPRRKWSNPRKTWRPSENVLPKSWGRQTKKLPMWTADSQLPSALQQLETEKHEQASQTYQLHKCLRPISGSAEADKREIQEADDIRLRAIAVIQSALGAL